MLIYAPLLSCVLTILLAADPGAQPWDRHAPTPQSASMTASELESTWGGLFGSRIGKENGGILELSCGDEDLWPASQPWPWYALGGYLSTFGDCGNGAPHFLPRYADPADVIVSVSASFTGIPSQGNPQLEIYVNGAPLPPPLGTPFATVPCTERKDWDHGTALPAPGSLFSALDLRAWECPESQEFIDAAFISLETADLHEGLNSVTAVVTSGNFQGHQDQETRFFCIGTDACLPARVRLRPIADGSVNDFAALPSLPRWDKVNDYPEPVLPCPSGGGTFVAAFGEIPATKTQLFVVGGASVPPATTFESCTIRTQMSLDPLAIGDCAVGSDTEPTWLLVRSGANENAGAQIQPSVGLREYTRVMTLNPLTGLAWTSADLANLEIGVRRTNIASSPRGLNVWDMVLDCAF